jgi:copper oxidase (laccase) domain-containing protein
LVSKEGLVLLHVGWKGLVAGIVERGVECLGPAKDIKAIFGPCIRGCCYEVDESFIKKVEEAYPHISYGRVVTEIGERLYFDIPFAVEEVLRGMGVKALLIAICVPFATPTFPRTAGMGRRREECSPWPGGLNDGRKVRENQEGAWVSPAGSPGCS